MARRIYALQSHRPHEEEPWPAEKAALRWNGFEASADEIIESAERINRTIGQRYLKKIDDDWLARRHDMDSGKMLRFMLEMRREQEAKARKNRPDAELLRREAEETAERVRAALAHLAPLERKIIHLHFDRSWPARRIAESLGMKNQRNAYYRIKKTIAKLKNLLDIDEK
jgi:RNA polymerase sigma factor (sigma-70 family)